MIIEETSKVLSVCLCFGWTDFMVVNRCAQFFESCLSCLSSPSFEFFIGQLNVYSQ